MSGVFDFAMAVHEYNEVRKFFQKFREAVPSKDGREIGSTQASRKQFFECFDAESDDAFYVTFVGVRYRMSCKLNVQTLNGDIRASGAIIQCHRIEFAPETAGLRAVLTGSVEVNGVGCACVLNARGERDPVYLWEKELDITLSLMGFPVDALKLPESPAD